MAKRIPAIECSLENCGENFARCGKTWTHSKYKCRCTSCCAAKSERQKNDPNQADRNRRYREENRDRLRAYARERSSLPHRREAAAQYRAKNREKLLKYFADRYESNREYALEFQRQWALEHPEQVKANQRKASAVRRSRMRQVCTIPFTAKQLAQRFDYYGNSCYLKLDGCTGGADHVDHVKPISKGGPNMLANLRPACRHCNVRKGNKWPFVA